MEWLLELLRGFLSLFGKEDEVPELPEDEDTEDLPPPEEPPPANPLPEDAPTLPPPDQTLPPPPDLEDEPTSPTGSVTELRPIILEKPIPQHYEKSNGSEGSRWYSGWTRTPWVIVLHYSAGYDAQGCMDALVDRGLSVHCTIERDGQIWRHVGDENRCIHAGYGRWGGFSGMNSHALGFEIVNLGWLQGPNDGTSGFKGNEVNPQSDGTEYFRIETYKDSQGRVKATRVLTDTRCIQVPDHRDEWKSHWWSAYPEEQLQSVFWQVWQWIKKYDIMLENVIGHEHVTPHRKQDPGPHFPWMKLEAYLREKALVESPKLLDPEYNQSERIKAVQSHCARMGLPVGDVDGVWGSKTAKAVEEAVGEFGELYRFADLEVRKDNCLAIANALRLVPGFDPDRR